MLGFVTSLPHPANSASYDVRCELLQATLASVLGQTTPDLAVVVVANEPPVHALPADDRIELCLVPFGPKASPPGKPSPQGIFADKGAKLAVGSAHAVGRGAGHVMWVDSDDFVHRDIAAFVAEHPDAPGWYFDAGYFHVRGTRRMREVRHDYHQHNGSSHIVRADLVGVPADLDGLDRDGVLDAVGREPPRSGCSGGTRRWSRCSRRRGRRCSRSPSPPRCGSSAPARTAPASSRRPARGFRSGRSRRRSG